MEEIRGFAPPSSDFVVIRRAEGTLPKSWFYLDGWQAPNCFMRRLTDVAPSLSLSIATLAHACLGFGPLETAGVEKHACRCSRPATGKALTRELVG